MIEATDKSLDADNAVVSDSERKDRPQTVFERVIASPYMHTGLLLLIVAVCFGRTLSSYFLADDFGEISYVSRIFNGEPQLFWSNFTGNYMQIPGMNVYRPWLLVSLVIDFLLYRANATGYYFSNLAYFTGVVFLVYFVTRQLTTGWSRTRSGVAAFFGAALFAANPLRCESVSWVVGRVDIICCFFYLSSYLFFLKSRAAAKKQRLFTALGVASFFLAMGTKEMAIGLPVLLALTAFFGIGEASRGGSVRDIDRSGLTGLPTVQPISARLRDAALFSAPLWISAFVYFVIRYACLGTLGGGYVAGFGASQLSYMVQRWLDPDTVKRLFYPLGHSLFGGQTAIYSDLLTGFYGSLAGLMLIRLVEKKLSLKWFLFLSGWLATAAVPIFQLWGLGFDLEGSRFYFFLSIPLCLLAPILLFRPTVLVVGASRDSSSASELQAGHSASELKILVATAVILTGLGCVLGRIACLTDLEWVHAGKENKMVSQAAQKLAESAQSELLPVLGIPKERNGAHQILNGSTFGTMLSPPFTSVNYAQRFATFDPVMFGPPEYIDATRFKSVLKNSHGQFFVWSSRLGNFEKLHLDSAATPVGISDLPIAAGVTGWLPNAHGRAIYKLNNSVVEMTALQEGDGVRVAGLNVDPMSADFLQFDYKATGVPEGARFKVFSSGDGRAAADAESSVKESSSAEGSAAAAGEAVAELAMKNSDSFKTVRVPLSRYWRWFCQGRIDSITVQPYPCSKISMRNFKLLSSNTVSPALKFVGAACDGAGIYRADSDNVVVKLDSRNVADAAGFEIELGKVNYFFNNFEKVEGASPVETSIMTDLKSPEVRLYDKDFSAPGFYELRAFCVDREHKPLGEYSDILTLRISKRLNAPTPGTAKK